MVGTGIDVGGQSDAAGAGCVRRGGRGFLPRRRPDRGRPPRGASIRRRNRSKASTGQGASRLDAYERHGRRRSLHRSRNGKTVCAAFYGHPGIFVYRPVARQWPVPAPRAFTRWMLPGISSLDCLFADLGIDPAETGVPGPTCQRLPRANRVHPDPSIAAGAPADQRHRRAGGHVEAAGLVRPDGAGRVPARSSTRPEHDVIAYEASPFPSWSPLVVDARASRRTDECRSDAPG